MSRLEHYCMLVLQNCTSIQALLIIYLNLNKDTDQPLHMYKFGDTHPTLYISGSLVHWASIFFLYFASLFFPKFSSYSRCRCYRIPINYRLHCWHVNRADKQCKPFDSDILHSILFAICSVTLQHINVVINTVCNLFQLRHDPKRQKVWKEKKNVCIVNITSSICYYK